MKPGENRIRIFLHAIYGNVIAYCHFCPQVKIPYNGTKKLFLMKIPLKYIRKTIKILKIFCIKALKCLTDKITKPISL